MHPTTWLTLVLVLVFVVLLVVVVVVSVGVGVVVVVCCLVRFLLQASVVERKAVFWELM